MHFARTDGAAEAATGQTPQPVPCLAAAGALMPGERHLDTRGSSGSFTSHTLTQSGITWPGVPAGPAKGIMSTGGAFDLVDELASRGLFVGRVNQMARDDQKFIGEGVPCKQGDG